MGKGTSFVVQNTARLFCRDMLQYTPPFSGKGPSNSGRSGMDNIARDKGRANVSRDVRKIFAPLAQAPADEVAVFGNIGVFSAWAKEKMALPGPHYPQSVFDKFDKKGFYGVGEFEEFQRIVKNPNSRKKVNFVLGTTESAIKTLHESIRGRPSYKVVETSQSNKVYVDNWKVVENYIKKVQQRVGKLKSGWYFAGLELGKMPNVSWISGQPSIYKICIKNLIGNNPHVTIGTTNGRNYSAGYHLMRAAMNHRAFVMRNEILYFLKNNPGSLRQVIARIPQGFNIVNTNP